MDKKIVVQKMGAEPVLEIPKKKPFLKSILKKTSKLKLKGVRDPAKTSHRHTIKLLTSRGHRRRDKTLKKKIGGLTDKKVSELTKDTGLIKNPEMPTDLKRQILGAAVSAGFVSL